MKKVSHLILLLFFVSNLSFSQNIFDLENSVKYAEHLYNTKNFNSAVKEYERIVILAPDSSEYIFRLLQSYKNSKQIKKGTEKIVEKFGRSYRNFPQNILHIYLQFLILQDQYSECHEILKKQTTLTQEAYQEFILALYLLENKRDSADVFINKVYCAKTDLKENIVSNKFSELSNLYYQQNKINYKNPMFASLLSTFIPGLGKIYTNDVKNGLGVLSIISLYSWQSYRGFKHEGINSFYGWGFGALATGFYIGNIYGSHQSAKRENTFQDKIIAERVKQILTEN